MHKRIGETPTICCFCAVGCGAIVASTPGPDGKLRVVNLEGDPDHPINQGSLYTTTLDESTIGKPKLLLKQYHQDNFYYPAFSPDGKWVLFNKSMEGSYGSDQAELWIIRSTGGKPIMLARANKAKLLRNSWPRWAPFTQLYNGRSIWWFSFSSVRDYGTDLVNTGASHSKKVTQIWMCAFDPALAAKGKDPSFPAFWVPFQDLKSKNHIAQWTKTVPVVN